MLTFLGASILAQTQGIFERDPEYPFGYRERSAILRTANYYRQMAGLPAAKWHMSLERAARAHTLFKIRNRDKEGRISAHEETPGFEGFTGKTSRDRILAAGLNPRRTGENMSYGSASPVSVAEGLLDVPYHRRSWVQTGELLLGAFGVENKTWTVNFASPDSPGFSIWPPDNCQNVPTRGNVHESPDPMELYPGEDKNVGYVLTVFFSGAKVTSGTATLTLAGNPVRVLVNSPQNDRHCRDGVVIIPTEELRPNAEYTASFSAIANGQQISKTWKFKTASKGNSFTFGDACKRLIKISDKESLIHGRVKAFDGIKRTVTLEKDYYSESTRGRTIWGKQEITFSLLPGCILRNEYDPYGIEFPEFKPSVGSKVMLVRRDPLKREISACLEIFTKNPEFLFEWE